MDDNVKTLNRKIRDFIRKYYVNKLIKGAALFVIITILAFITFSLMEYFLFFNTTVRAIFLYTFVALFLLTFIFYITIPLLKIFGLGKQISSKQAASIVGKHFPEIDDKLLNIIQLEEQMAEGNYKSYQLLSAAIDTKIDQIKPFPFIKAIPFKTTFKFARWALIPVLIFALIFSIKSEVFTDSTKRIVNYQHYYEKPAPYGFEIENNQLTVFQNEDFLLKFNVVGEEAPSEVFIFYGNKNYKCSKISNTEFSYSFSKLQKDTEFQIITEEVSSMPYTIKVLPKPVTISFVMELDYPSYLNKNRDIIDNNGDATVPEGTKITWKFYTKNTDTLTFIHQDQVKDLLPEKDYSMVSLWAKSDLDYSVVNKNRFYTGKDTLKHSIIVVKDRYPEILVESQRDTFFVDRLYFKGNIKDDYGFYNLKFIYSKYDDKGNLLESDKSVDIEINKQNTIQDFYHYFDAGILQLDPGYKVDYYFEVRDNDAVNGYKASRSSSQTFHVKTIEEINQELDQSSSQTKTEMNQLLSESAQLLKDIEKLNQQLMQSDVPSWQDKKKMESLMEQYNELKQKLENINKEQKQKNLLEEQYKDFSSELLEKQKEIQKRMEELLTDEMKEMIQKMQEMMDMNKNQMQEMMDKIKTTTEDLNKSLDVQLQLMKQLEYEKKANDIINTARELANEEQLLSKESLQKAINKDELVKKQEDLQQKFQNLQKDLKDLKQLNSELEEPNKQTNTDDLQKQIKDAMQESKESLSKNNRSKASGKQEESAQKMEELADQVEEDLLDSQEEDLAEDIETLRQILDNLVRISFDQESNMIKAKSLNTRSSALTDVIREQFNIKENFKMIEDSLNSLARRQPQVQPFVLKEVGKINDYLGSSQTNINDRKIQQAASNQQFVLTSMNNLALMLAESMKNMKDQLKECQNCKNGKPKKDGGSCNKPGQGQKAKSARELQQQLNRQMEALKKSMEQGEGQPGGEGGNQKEVSEQLAKMAAQQEAIRKMMQDIQGELKSQDGVGNKSIEQMIRDMEQTEKDLVNRMITQQTINRQKNIETRLLESEKADMQREQEEKRESTEASQVKNFNPPKEWNMDKNSEQQNEMFKTVPVNLNYYYKEKVNQYFFNIED